MEIKRDIYLELLISRIDNGAIKVITGIRRAGKSFLLFNLFYNYLLENGVANSKIICIPLDDEKFEELCDYKKLGEYIRSKTKQRGKYFIFLDEIQFCPHFEKVLNGLNRNQNLDVYVTGSNSKFLSSDILTEFRGRGDEIRVQPLSFYEYYNSLKNPNFSDAFDDYINYGGLPRIRNLKTEEQKVKYLKNLFSEVYIKDLTERNNLRGEIILDNLIDILASSVGSLSNPTKIANTFKSEQHKNVSDKTIKNYIEYLSNAFLIQQSKRFDIKGRKYISASSKIYFTDLGLRNARLNFRQTERTHLMENLIYNELLFRGYNVDIGVVEITEKQKNGKYSQIQTEIDFVCNLGNKRYYIQSAYSLETEEKRNTEIRPLLKVDDSFKKIVIVRETMKPTRDNTGIVTMGLKNFLLDLHSLDY